VSKHFTTGIPKGWNTEMRKTPFGASFKYWELEVSKHFTTRMPKCRNAEMRKTPFGASFGYQELEVSKHFTTGMPKCKKHLLVQVSDTGSWSVKTLHHRNTEMSECRNVKNTFWCRFRIPGVGVSRYFSTGMLKCRNAEM
jgi:hypothetical protein